MPLKPIDQTTPEEAKTELPILLGSRAYLNDLLDLREKQLVAASSPGPGPGPGPGPQKGRLLVAYVDLDVETAPNTVTKEMMPIVEAMGGERALWLYASHFFVDPPKDHVGNPAFRPDWQDVVKRKLDGYTGRTVTLDIESETKRAFYGLEARHKEADTISDRRPTTSDEQKKVIEQHQLIYSFLKDAGGVEEVGWYAHPWGRWEKGDPGSWPTWGIVGDTQALGLRYDFLSPSIYDAASVDFGDSPSSDDALRDHTRKVLEEAIRLVGGDTTLVRPTIWERYHQWSRPSERHLLPTPEFMRDQITVAMALGIRAFNWWGKNTSVLLKGHLPAFTETVTPLMHPWSAAFVDEWPGHTGPMTDEQVNIWLRERLPFRLAELLTKAIG